MTGLPFPSALHQDGLLPSLLLPTHETLDTYFASVSPLGKNRGNEGDPFLHAGG